MTHPLPEHNYQFHFPNTEGLVYEAVAVRSALMQSRAVLEFIEVEILKTVSRQSKKFGR